MEGLPPGKGRIVYKTTCSTCGTRRKYWDDNDSGCPKCAEVKSKPEKKETKPETKPKLSWFKRWFTKEGLNSF